MKSVFIFFTLFTTQPLWAYMSIAIENIENKRLGKNSEQSFTFQDSKEQQYSILCEKYLWHESVTLFLMGSRFTAHYPNCTQALKQVLDHIKSGQTIDSIIVDISYRDGTKQPQAEMTFLSDGKPIQIVD